MPLTDKQLRSLKPSVKAFRISDARGLYVEISPSGSKLWRYKYRVNGKEKRLALGRYPDVTLSEARAHRDQACLKLREGLDPCLERKREKLAARLSAAATFSQIADEYIQRMADSGRADATLKKARWFKTLVDPAIGDMPIADIDPQMLLAALKKFEARGTYETAKKCRSFISRVYKHAAVTGRASSDPAAMLQGALINPKARHFAAILEPSALGAFLRAVEGYDGSPITKLAMQILPHVFLRPGELRLAVWDEICFEKNVWQVPLGRMKSRRPHSVPLSSQVIGLLKQLQTLSGLRGYIFPAVHSSRKPMSENTINAAFRRMGFGQDEVTAHGFRATASTLLNECGHWNPDAIERSLAHGLNDSVRAIYHRGEHWYERVKMMQWWSDHLDELRSRSAIDCTK